VRFWDSSALVPLLISEPRSRVARGLLSEDRGVVLWWGTPIECASALWRRRRNADIDRAVFEEAVEALASYRSEADIVSPGEGVLGEAFRILSVHAIGSGDALQLSAALVRWRSAPADAEFVCFDRRLREAARREGFLVLPSGPSGPEGGVEAAETTPSYGGTRRHALTKIRKR
jgi:uncharacterized protein